MAGGFGDGIVGGVNVGFEVGGKGGDEGELTQPSNITARGIAKASTRKNSLNDFIYSAKRYVNIERIRDTITAL
jgi:hypothetical protein